MLGVVLAPLASRGTLPYIHLGGISCEATRLVAAEPIAFSPPPSGLPMHCHIVHKVPKKKKKKKKKKPPLAGSTSTSESFSNWYKVGCSIPPHNRKCPSLLWACTIKGVSSGSEC